MKANTPFIYLCKLEPVTLFLGGGVEKCAHLIIQLERDGGSERTTNTDSLSDCESRVVAKNMFC